MLTRNCPYEDCKVVPQSVSSVGANSFNHLGLSWFVDISWHYLLPIVTVVRPSCFFVDRYIMILSWYYLRPQSSPNRSCRVETHQTNQQLRHGGDADQGGAAARSPGTAAGPDGRAAVTWWKSRKFMVPLGIARKIPREMDDIIWIYQLDGYIYIYYIPPGIFLIIIDDIMDYYGYIIRWYHIFSGIFQATRNQRFKVPGLKHGPSGAWLVPRNELNQVSQQIEAPDRDDACLIHEFCLRDLWVVVGFRYLQF